jgi:hypothetical protein
MRCQPRAAALLYSGSPWAVCNAWTRARKTSVTPIAAFRVAMTTSPLARDPPRFNKVKPGTLAGQSTDDQATAALTFDTLVVCLKPLRHDWTAVPGRIAPDQHQGLRRVLSHPFSNPGAIGTGDLVTGRPATTRNSLVSVCGRTRP